MSQDIRYIDRKIVLIVPVYIEHIMFSLLEFVGTCRAETTTKAYRLALASFIESVYSIERKTYQRTPEHLRELDELSRKYLTEEREYAADILRFVQANKQLSPKALRVRVEAVKLWLEFNELEISKPKLKRILNVLPRARALTQDQDLSVDIIRPLYENMSLPGRALILVLASSGMRLGEVLTLRLDDINLETSPIEITIRAEVTKIKEGRYTFISTEAGLVLKEWLRNRPAWIQSMQNRGGALGMKKSLDDPRIFPFSPATVSRMIVHGLQKSGVYQEDERTGRSRITAHSFRKFFLSQLKTGMPAEQVELIAGHSGYLSDSYRRYPKDQVRQSYLKAEYAVSLSGGDVQVRADLQQQKAVVQSVVSENLRLKADLDDIKEKVEKITVGTGQIDATLTALPDDVKRAIIQAAAEKMG